VFFLFDQQINFLLSQWHPLLDESRENRPNQHRSSLYFSPDNGGHGCCQPHLFNIFEWTTSSILSMARFCAFLWPYITTRLAADVRRQQPTSSTDTNIPTTPTISSLYTRSSEQWSKVESIRLSCLCVLTKFAPTTILPITTAINTSIISSC
jgi:hypothetical protein